MLQPSCSRFLQIKFSTNPRKTNSFISICLIFHPQCTFQLSDDWFPPAEASHKRSVIQKLIHQVVTGSFQNHPKLVCSNKQLDERHQSRNAEGEPAGDFPAQSCSADEAELVCTIRDDAHGAQESTSICLNDSEEKVLSASGGMVNTGMVSMVDGENLQEPGVCY
jgi:sentrin-specific protease 7